MLALVLAAAVLCPQKLELDPKQWSEALQKAEPGSAEQARLIDQMGLRKVPSGSDLIPDADCGEQPKVLRIELLPAKLTGGKDLIVRARFEMCADEPQSHFYSERMAVLATVPGGYCKLGGLDLGIDTPASDACGGPPRPPRSISLEHLTSAERDTLLLEDHLDGCPGSARTVSETTTYVDARGSWLLNLFSMETESVAWAAPDEPARAVERSVRATGKFPRKLLVTEEVSCAGESANCKPGKKISTWVLRGARYIPQ
jgi:hypothetical protein